MFGVKRQRSCERVSARAQHPSFALRPEVLAQRHALSQPAEAARRARTAIIFAIECRIPRASKI